MPHDNEAQFLASYLDSLGDINCGNGEYKPIIQSIKNAPVSADVYHNLAVAGKTEINLLVPENSHDSMYVSCKELAKYVKSLVKVCTTNGRIQGRVQLPIGAVGEEGVSLEILPYGTRDGRKQYVS
jgi:hypothetical protein